MIISLIAAMAQNRVIGQDNRLPWRLPADMKRFRELTMGHPVIMGRKTFESIGRPLPGRKNIVVTGQRHYRCDGCVVAQDLAAAFAACEGADEVFILGGAKLFRDTINIADRIYLTVVQALISGDARFPEIPGDFRLTERVATEDAVSLEFLRYERNVPETPEAVDL